MAKESRKSRTPNLEIAEKLWDLWLEHVDGSREEKNAQLCERIIGLLSLEALPETKAVFKQLEAVLDFECLIFSLGMLYYPIGIEEWRASHISGEDATDRLLRLWLEHAGITKSEMTRQISERVFGLLSLAALPETEAIFNKVEKKINFADICERVGSLSISGFTGGSQSLLEPF